MKLQKITPFLWFNNGAAEAARFYLSVFKNGQLVTENTFVTMVELEGLQISLLNGGPKYTLSPAFSLSILCDTQEEIDYYWEKLTEDGEESRCGWLTDKYGVSWQVVPAVLPQLLSDPEKAPRVTQAFLQMKKFDIQQLLDA
jgi:predicted 3-demethylubiquinone-9 3-methyltransferase (glyoxalase superfamily)